MADYTTKDAVELPLSGNSGEFKKTIHDILSARVNDAIELKKIDVASSFMNSKEEDTLPSEVEPEVEAEQEPEESEDETTEV